LQWLNRLAASAANLWKHGNIYSCHFDCISQQKWQ